MTGETISKHLCIPYIDGHTRVDEVIDLDEEEAMRQFGYSSAEAHADLYVHYVSCQHVLVEIGSIKEIEKAIKQLSVSLERILSKQCKVDYVAIVGDGLGNATQKKYRVVKEMLYKRSVGRAGPVKLNGTMPVHYQYKSKVVERRRREKGQRRLLE